MAIRRRQIAVSTKDNQAVEKIEMTKTIQPRIARISLMVILSFIIFIKDTKVTICINSKFLVY